MDVSKLSHAGNFYSFVRLCKKISDYPLDNALLGLLIALGAVSPRIKKLLDSGQDHVFARLFKSCREFSEGGIAAVVIVLSAAMLLAAWILLRRQKVEI